MIIPHKIDILGFTKNKQAALKMQQEISRIGLQSEIFWNIASRWDKFCIDHLTKIIPYMKKISAFSCNRGHYHLLQKAVDFNDESIWIVEDDTRFLKDEKIIFSTLNNTPPDADILILDSLAAGNSNSKNVKQYYNKIATCVNGWFKVEYEDLRNCGNYIVGKNALARYAEIASRGCDNKIARPVDVMRNYNWFPSCKIYAAYPNLSIQRIDPTGCHMASNSLLIERYQTMRINTDNYQQW